MEIEMATEKNVERLLNQVSIVFASSGRCLRRPVRHLALARTLSKSTKALCVSAGAGHEVSAVQESGVSDVNGIDTVEFHTLVHRADPHNVPIFDNVFDLVFNTGASATEALILMERTVRRGRAIVLGKRHLGLTKGDKFNKSCGIHTSFASSSSSISYSLHAH